jgi:selenocysteine lyase/cysteine desulfurase
MDFDQALAEFLATHPDYDHTAVEQLRAREYGRLDTGGHVYLDYTGGGLHAASQLRKHFEMLETEVAGNPHSHNPTSAAMTERVERARAAVLGYFRADPEEYLAIFTPNASGALKLVGESYPFAPGSRLLLSFDNHNSVNGIREFARARGAELRHAPILADDLRLDAEALRAELAAPAADAPRRLFAYSAQSNFSGVQHPLDWIAEARDAGWDVLLDAAAFVPTNRLDLSRHRPDFAVVSFYKMFGYPTGLGCLLARREAVAALRRPWFAGGTITIASVQGDGYFHAEGEAAFEDGTVNYLGIPALETGLRHIENIGIETIHHRVMALTDWLLARLAELRHSNGQAMIEILGPPDTRARGGTISFSLLAPRGHAFDERMVESLAAENRISLRTGCFCNPGAGEVAHHLSAEEMHAFFKKGGRITFERLRVTVREQYCKSIASIRISAGIASTFSDVFRFIAFLRTFRDRPAADVGCKKVSDDPTRRDTT